MIIENGRILSFSVSPHMSRRPSVRADQLGVKSQQPSPLDENNGDDSLRSCGNVSPVRGEPCLSASIKPCRLFARKGLV